MADLEQHAFRRDRRFVVRLVLALLIGFACGLFAYGQLTSRRSAGCAADLFAPAAPQETSSQQSP